ncbi:MAG: GNAT family N-acetyltransferase [Clostridiales bacterium]|nr:GNAT family N-acetyltransferase [Clostridiales bacterium]MDD7035930.1 GNAT family N-acetyltransferase [Bacillota bacterium]MDY2921145.1 GNAT family N-acetyltransferase [Lentihominibacter sp.]
MELRYGRLDELTIREIYEIFRLRVSVFVVEQNCPYQEIDDADKEAIHMWLEEDGRIMAYLRVIPAGLVFDQVSIGRVIAVKRRCGLATRLIKEGIKTAAEELGATEIVLEAQTYARSLYEKLGFCQISEEFLEDGIPHIKMRLEI